MFTPYEVIVKTILPAIRSILVRELAEKYGYKQMEIARHLYITQASVSYYLTHSRGKYIQEVAKYPDVTERIKRLAEKIHREKPTKEELIKEINDIIMYIMAKEYICEVHKTLEPDVDIEECKVCEAMIIDRYK